MIFCWLAMCWNEPRIELTPFGKRLRGGGKPYEDQHPTTTLDKWLKACRDGKCDDTMKLAFHYQGCVYAWNAFREARTIKDIKFNTTKGLYVPMS